MRLCAATVNTLRQLLRETDLTIGDPDLQMTTGPKVAYPMISIGYR